LFGVCLFILEPLMGDLRPSAKNPDEFEAVTPPQEIKKEYQTAIKTNLPAPIAPANQAKPAEKAVSKTNPPAPSAPANSTKPAKVAAPMTNPPAPSASTNLVKPAKVAVPMTNPPAPGTSTNLVKPPEAAVPKTNQPAQSAPTNATLPVPAKPVEVTAKYFAVKGVTRNAAKSAVTIQSGTKIYIIFLGETALTQTPDGPTPVRFKDLGDDWVVLEINGEQVKLPIH
jgi:hypothetical protein